MFVYCCTVHAVNSQNIWHSTLRSKNSERRSFLRTYARAVRDCASDAEARKQAYEMAYRVCGPPQPIELAIAAVQQQYQQLLQLQASQQDEMLGEGDSPEYVPDGDMDGREHESHHPTPGLIAPTSSGPAPPSRLRDQQELQELQEQHAGQEPHVEAFRSGTCSRTNSAPDSQQLSGAKGMVAPEFHRRALQADGKRSATLWLR